MQFFFTKKTSQHDHLILYEVKIFQTNIHYVAFIIVNLKRNSLCVAMLSSIPKFREPKLVYNLRIYFYNTLS